MKAYFRIWAVLTVIIFMTLLAHHHSGASSYATPIDSKYLNGIDTIVIQVYGAPDSKLLESQFKHKESYPLKIVLETSKEVFSSLGWIKVTKYSDLVARSEKLRPNMLGVYFALSAQQEFIDGKSVTVAALTVSYRRFFSDGSSEEISTLMPVSYPFIASANQTDFSNHLIKGVKFLTHYVPSHLCHANKARNICESKESDYHPW